jgi:hypothetical protein
VFRKVLIMKPYLIPLLRLPYLRTEVLEHFADHKLLSKSEVEREFSQHIHTTNTNRSVRHHRPEILEAFKYLENEKLIVNEGYANPGPGIPLGIGRPKARYRITEEGLKELIADKSISESQFWKILVSYSLNHSILTLDELDKFLQIFLWRHLKYRDHGFATFIDVFYAIYNNWFKERILLSDRLSTLQKVLEVIALYPKITFNDLVEKVDESKSKIRKVLAMCSYGHGSSVMINQDYKKENYEFVINNIITVNRENNDGLTFELSLFGIILTLLMVLYNDRLKLTQGLYLKEYSFEEYCDKIAHNYNHKLPLIFGKWAHLRQILQVFAIYNFVVVLLDEPPIESGSSSFSVNTEGKEQIFHGIRTIMQYNNGLMQDLVKAGTEALGDYFSVRFDLEALERLRNDKKFNKINPICAALEEIIILLNPLWYHYPRLSLITFTTLDPNRILKQMEEAFADEISAFYYMYFFNHNIKAENSSKVLTHNLEGQLSLLFQEVKTDPLLKDWVKKWTKDLSSIYKQISKNMEWWSSHAILA